MVCKYREPNRADSRFQTDFLDGTIVRKLSPGIRVLIATLAFQIPSIALAHSGGLNAQGCHAGSQPYHCHRSQETAPQSGPEVKLSRTGICHIRGSRYYAQTKNFVAYTNLDTCIRAGGRLPAN